MKSGKKVIITMVVLFSAISAIYAVQEKVATDTKASIQLRYIAQYAELAYKLTGQYQQEFNGVEITVATIPESNLDEFLRSGGIVLANKTSLSANTWEQGLKVAVGRDVIVPVISGNNPQKDYIIKNGMSPQQFASIYKSGGNLTWGQLLGTNDPQPVKAYVPGNHSYREYLAEFFGATPGEISATEVNSHGEMIGMIDSDPNAIGFCTLACLAEMEKSGVKTGISLVPVDMDGDGTLERFENIYGSYAELAHGIFVGRYPRQLYGKIFAMTGGHQATKAETAFLEWMITGGQELVASAGILTIDYSERASGLRALHPAATVNAELPVQPTTGRTLMMLLGGVVLLAILVWVISGRIGKRHPAYGERHSTEPGLFGADTDTYPEGLFYDRSHTWAFMEMTGNVRIGIDHFIPNVTGTLTRVAMKSPGEKISRGETLFTIVQQGKKIEIKSPLSGVVLQHNEALLDDASLLNSDPFTAGWVYMLKPLNWRTEMSSFFMGEPYGIWLKAEMARLRDFFATGLKFKDSQMLVPVLQDGGEIREGVLKNLGPEVWEEFQSGFINRK
jgi:glycine cleavage system H lipoate-binding protein/ABC-type phosphate transport system substrate-binding protein